MPDTVIVDHCSPTLAGLKTANLFSIRFDTMAQMLFEVKELDRQLRKKGLRAIALRYLNGLGLVYIYRPAFLERDLAQAEAQAIFRSMGYSKGSACHMLWQLMLRLQMTDSFPHEIGLFLGYPPYDVASFIQDPGKGLLISGTWKAYHNRDQAEKTFALYKKYTHIYQKVYQKGRTLSQLTVAVR
ncbi:MAG: DUF3793 family protein [Firmicutes bacterium]|nr:DUF3793 family protein [Bacillota bacterium]